jgi:hypothetical protein
MTSSEFRERFLDSNDRSEAAMLAAIRAHREGGLVFDEALTRMDHLEESVDELKQLILAQGVELRALRQRLDG